MRLVPSGNRRKMVAQSLDDGGPLGIDFGQGVESLPSSPLHGQAVAPEKEMVDNVVEDKMEEREEDGTPDLSEYIFEKLVGFGHPPRRLEQFQNEFVTEKIFPEGAREVSIVIPDRYYGSKKRLSQNDLNAMIKEVQDKFGLIFSDAERSDMKLTMNFTSSKISDEEDNEDAIDDDVLSQVYGSPNESKSKKKKDKKASNVKSVFDLFKEAREAYFDGLRKVGE